MAASRVHAAYGDLSFTVTPGGTINIQNLSGAAWYFYNNPTPTTVTMSRVSEDLSQSWVWGSPQFQRDLNGIVSKVNPREWLRVNAGSTASGSVIHITYHDISFDTNYPLDISVQQSATAVVSTINRLDPNPSTSSTIRWEITFNRAVAGVRLQNLALSYPNNGQALPTVTDIAPSSLAHNKWTVTVNRAGREAGTLALRWNGSSIEMPPAPTALTGDAYDLAPIAPTIFSVRQYGYINIRNVMDDGWYFASPPALSTVTMYRAGEDENVIDQWGSDNFGPDITGSGRNRIARSQSLRIYAGETPIGTTIVVNYQIAQGVSRSVSILVTAGTGQLLSVTRLDANPPMSNTVRWLATFDRPVGGVRASNFSFYNFTGTGVSITNTMPDVASGFRKWTITAQIGSEGHGAIEPSWNSNSFYFHPESPYVGNSPQAERYDVNPLVFSVPPGGSIDIENFYADQLHFRDAPTPATAQMSRVGSDTVGILPWGTSGFMPGSSNWLAPGDYLRVDAGGTPVGTPILARAYRTTYNGDPGFEIRIKVEVPDAQVVSCNIIDSSPTVANSVRWDVTFNKAMSGVTAANFGFINSGHIEPTPTITSVTVVPNSGNTTWRVTADTTGTGTGLLGLRYLGHRTETPNAPNTFTGQSYQFSEYPLITVNPTPLSAIIVTGGQAPTLSVTATIRTADPLYYQWRIGSPQDPYLGVNDPKNVSGATSRSFTPPTNAAGHRSYYCRVFTLNPNTGDPSGYYANSLPATMHVYDPPAIVTQPGTIVLPPHGTGTFNVGTTGSELVYQWYQGTVGDRTHPLSGETGATLWTPELTANTRYWVLVWNALGSSYEVQSESAWARVVTQIELAQSTFTPVVNSTIDNMKARALDSDGNATPGATLTFQSQSLGVINGNTAGGNFSGAVPTGGTASGTAVTGSDGWATSPAMWTNTKSGSYQVVAKSQGPQTYMAAASMTINNQPGAATALAWITQPSSNAVAGVAFASQPSLLLGDTWGNAVNGSYTVTASADKGLGTLQGTTTIQTLNGQVTFTDLSHHTAEKIALRIQTGSIMTLSSDITVVAGPAALITVSNGSPQGTQPGMNFTSKLTARLKDNYGNGISGKMVKFSAPTSGASATFPSGDSITTDAFGDATVTARANMSAGSYDVVAAPTQVTLPQGATFQLWNYSALQMWRTDNFGSWQDAGTSANTAMPFNDGVPNLLKYAFNLNATAADSTTMTTAGVKGLPLVQKDQQGHLTVTFVRRRAATSPGISYAVQFAGGLTSSSFAENPHAVTSTPVAVDATWERVVVTDSVTTTQTAQRFVRVQVTEL